jgi:lipopolysaccharide/colanic/teichoic acid biosynthesis glycosyltransferase
MSVGGGDLPEAQAMKRAFDFIVALSALTLLAPLFIIICVIILFTVGWPIFYRQIRVGKGAVPFKIVKLRTMVRTADRKGPTLTIDGDPRITAVGRLLRRTKLDELPQLLNVLWGDMSLVGPRPEVAEYVRLYNERQLKVLSVRPGLTDPASIVYRDEEKVLAQYDDAEKIYTEKIMPAKLKLNLSYIEKATFLTDLGIIIKTLQKLFQRR